MSEQHHQHQQHSQHHPQVPAMEIKSRKPTSAGRVVGIVIGTVIGFFLLIFVLVALITALGHMSSTFSDTSVSNTPSTTAPSPTPVPAPQAAKIGDTVTVGGDQGLAVTLTSVTDPAQSDNAYITPDAGNRYIAAKLVIVNKGTSSYKDDANNNLTLIGSDNQSYTADFAGDAGCTNFSNGTYTLAPGASATGCVMFQVPQAVTAAKLQFGSLSGMSGDTGEWLAK